MSIATRIAQLEAAVAPEPTAPITIDLSGLSDAEFARAKAIWGRVMQPDGRPDPALLTDDEREELRELDPKIIYRSAE